MGGSEPSVRIRTFYSDQGEVVARLTAYESETRELLLLAKEARRVIDYQIKVDNDRPQIAQRRMNVLNSQRSSKRKTAVPAGSTYVNGGRGPRTGTVGTGNQENPIESE